MSRIVCGIFDASLRADAAIDQLKREGFSSAEITSFALNPPGAHDLTAIGGDVHSDAGARSAGAGAATGALIGLFPGLALGLIASINLGPASIALTTLLGALIGAFAGAMRALHNPRRSEVSREHPDEPRAGRMVAANVDRAGTDERVIAILKRHGARDVARADGRLRNGSWDDFDPRSPLAAV